MNLPQRHKCVVLADCEVRELEVLRLVATDSIIVAVADVAAQVAGVSLFEHVGRGGSPLSAGQFAGDLFHLFSVSAAPLWQIYDPTRTYINLSQRRRSRRFDWPSAL